MLFHSVKRRMKNIRQNDVNMHPDENSQLDLSCVKTIPYFFFKVAWDISTQLHSMVLLITHVLYTNNNMKPQVVPNDLFRTDKRDKTQHMSTDQTDEMMRVKKTRVSERQKGDRAMMSIIVKMNCKIKCNYDGKNCGRVCYVTRTRRVQGWEGKGNWLGGHGQEERVVLESRTRMIPLTT